MPAEFAIELENVEKTYPGGHVALRGVSLRVAEGETLALLGPSGCGKTTTLKLVNRLLSPTSGRVFVRGRDVSRVDPVELRRGIGYVVQNAGLFPHLTAKGNAEIVPRLLGWSHSRRSRRIGELFELLGLGPELLSRYPAELSGGQRQRVGLARALAADPPILLMDEPFGALDPPTRERLQLEFAELRQRLRKTVVLVTHDVREAFFLADRVAVLEEGRLVQYGTPEEIRRSPRTPLVDAFTKSERGPS
ncbi:MAG: hypothetical protein KatS3mg076_0043 [Candidatus Binatia bacterium]|nr:MAG: hypothetical protein KatS3mg076_0043 [Candidatus Binatia bacterium]